MIVGRDNPPRTLVFDSSVLSAFAAARRLSVLRDLGETWGLMTTQAVLDELAHRDSPASSADLSWLRVGHVDALGELRVLGEYMKVLGSGFRDMGEATVLTWAEAHDGIAIIDDQAAKKAAGRRGVSCHGTLWLIVTEGYLAGRLDEAAARDLVDLLAEGNARFPCRGEDLFAWARVQGLLP